MEGGFVGFICLFLEKQVVELYKYTFTLLFYFFFFNLRIIVYVLKLNSG